MRPHRSHAPTLSSRSTSRASSAGGGSSGRRPPWMPAPDCGGSSTSGSNTYYSSQDAGEGTADPSTNTSTSSTTNGASHYGINSKKATIWTAASPIYARRKRRRSLIANATRLVWVGLGLTAVSELRGFFVVPLLWHDASSSTSSGNYYDSSGDAGYGRSAPGGLGGRYGRQASDVGLESRHAKKAGNTYGRGDGGGAKKYDKDKDPLADDDWTPDEAPAGIGGAGGIGGSNSIHGRSINAHNGIVNAAPMIDSAGGGMPRPVGLGAPAAGTTTVRGMGINSNNNMMGGFNGFNPNANANANSNSQMLQQPNPALAFATTQAIGRDAVKVTTRTTTLGGNVGGIGGIGDGMVPRGNTQGQNPWGQNLNPVTSAGSNGINDKETEDSVQVKSLQEKIAMLEGRLSSVIDGKDDTDSMGKTISDEGTYAGKYLRGGGAENGRETGASNVNAIPSSTISHGIDCTPYGGPDDDDILSDLVYWKDIHEDYSCVSPFHPTIKATAQDGGAAGGNGGALSRRYLTFEVDVHAGFNRNRMQFETMLAMAWAMGRILVLPPKWSLWPHEAGMANYNSFGDYYDLAALTKKYVGVDIVTMEEFLTKEAAAGRLQAGGSGKFMDSRSIALGRSLQPPSGKVDWDGDADVAQLFGYLETAALTPAWDFDTCIAAFPKSVEDDIESVNMGLNKMMSGIVRRSDGRPKPNPQSFQGKPTPVDAPPVERLREIMGKRELLCVYDEPMQEANVIHFRLVGAKGDPTTDEDHGPGHWYSSIFFEDHKHDLFVKRLIRDGLRYNDEIQCAAARVIKGIRKIAISNPKNTNEKDAAVAEGKGAYNALHLRRFRHSHEESLLSPADIGAAVGERFGDDGAVYVATDSKGDEADLLDHIDESVKIVALRNFITDIAKVDPKYYGMIDQVVASRSEKFLGTYHSSFTNGINRLRGYHTQKKQLSNQNGAIDSYYAAPKGKEGNMRVYKAVSKPFHAREYPSAWRSIDVGLDEAKTFKFG